MKGKYYLISAKHTYPDSASFTLWGPNGSGYAWYQTWAGIYSEDQIKAYEENEDIIIVPSDLIKYEFKPAIFDNMIVSLLPNNKEIRKLIGIRKSRLKGGMSKMTNYDVIWMHKLRVVGRRDQ